LVRFSPSIINGAVLKFERGGEYMLRLLQAVTRVESTRGWASLGPELLTDVFYSQVSIDLQHTNKH
jgi:hypothetical protein